MDKLRVLINAYACSPGMGSEPGMAWNWIVNLARYCELHVITEGEFREKIEAVVPTLEQGSRMHFYYNPVSDDVRRMCWNQGDWRFYKYYREWQWKTYLMAKDICQREKIDILHQLNMIGFREPGYLWRLSKENGLPFVWGPVDAKDKFPVTYLSDSGLKTKAFMRLKNLLTVLQLRFSSRVRKAVGQASVVFSASSNSQRSFEKYFKVKSPLLNETGCYPKDNALEDKTGKGVLDVLWVGKMDFRKQLGLAIRAVADSRNRNILLHVVGGGNDTAYKNLASQLGIANQCVWHGAVSHDEVQRLMQKSDVFLFTSVAEGTPHVVLEAIGNNLPVLCFNTCGQGDAVNAAVGVKLPLTTPSQSAKDFACILNKFERDRTILKHMSEHCRLRQQELSWDEKAKEMVKAYNSL